MIRAALLSILLATATGCSSGLRGSIYEGSYRATSATISVSDRFNLTGQVATLKVHGVLSNGGGFRGWYGPVECQGSFTLHGQGAAFEGQDLAGHPLFDLELVRE